MRVREHGGEHRGLLTRESRGRFMEVRFRGGLHAIHPAAEFRDVEIDLEDALFRPECLDQHREPRFESLANEAPAGPQKEILRDLLSERAGAAQPLAALARAHRLPDGAEIEAVME